MQRPDSRVRMHSMMIQTYPPAEGTHQQVTDDYGLFKVTLDKLLTAMGIKLKIPKVGGQEVDLHQLYKEVTTLGGLDLWVTVCEPFSFPSSFTNKSFVIKKLYLNALHHYEQVYFHRNTGPVLPPPCTGSEPAVILGSNPYDRNGMKRKPMGPFGMMGGYYSSQYGPNMGYFGPHGMLGPHGHPSAMHHTPDLLPGARFSGTVDSINDGVFNLTLELSTGQRIQGVMYCKPPPSSYSQQYKEGTVVTGSQNLGGGESSMAHSSHSQQQSRAATEGQVHKRMKTEHAADGPVPPRSALFFFASSVPHTEVTAAFPNMDITQATVQMASERWGRMSLEQRQPFLDRSNADRLRFEAETARMSSAGCPPAAAQAPPAAAVSANLPKVEGGEHASRPQHPYSQGANNSQAHQGYTLPPDPRYRTTHMPHMLPPSHPMVVVLAAAHAKAVSAALEAGAEPPPPPHMLGLPLGPYLQRHTNPAPSHPHNNPAPPQPKTEAEDYFSQKSTYQSSECDLYRQPFSYHAEDSCGPSNVDQSGQQKAYSHSNVDHVDQPDQRAYSHRDMLHEAQTLDYAEDSAMLQQLMDAGPLEGGGQHGGLEDSLEDDYNSMVLFEAKHDEQDAEFASLLVDANFSNEGNGRQTMSSVLDLGASDDADCFRACHKEMQEGMDRLHPENREQATFGLSSNSKRRDTNPSMQGTTAYADSPYSEHEHNYQTDGFSPDLVGRDGYPAFMSNMFDTTGDALDTLAKVSWCAD
eukprot:gene1998-33421_t